jgi:signal transduction histidine kinase/CheY-like chemotaxis protein
MPNRGQRRNFECAYFALELSELASKTMLSATLFESVFNSSPIGNYLLSPAPEAIILAVNDIFLEASGRRREDLIGVSLFDAFPGNPEDAKDTGEMALRSSLARVVATGKPDTLPTQRYPIRVELPDGEIVYEERFWNAVSTPICGADGKILCISHTTSDVTEQVRAVAALAESEKRFRALTSATADVIYRMSPNWAQMRQLDGRGFLKNTADPQQFWLGDYIPPEDQELVHKTIDEAIRSKAIFELEHRVHRVDGSCGWALSRAVPMLDADGEIYEWIGTASDITERKAAEEKLKASDRRKDEFLAMLAHELRNPIAPIGAAAELLQSAKLDESRLRQTSQVIGRQVLHMKHLIDDLLDVSRVTRGLVKLDNTPQDIRHIVMEAVEQVTPLIQERRHGFELHLPPETGMVMCDEKRLVQVLANILANAAKYTLEGGRLQLKTEMHASRIFIEIADNGIGMSPELVARAFDLFAQAERTSDRSSGGLGLGLALVKSLVELHGGTVTCESPGIGKGSRFTVCLPRLHLENSGDELHESGNAMLQESGALRIMVVDDNVDAATVLAMLLEAAGHQVWVEHRSDEALERAREAAPQVFLLDIGLPDMDGKELAKRLRADSRSSRTMLIAVTGYGQESDRNGALLAGFDHYLVKPIDTKQLYSILATMKKD